MSDTATNCLEVTLGDPGDTTPLLLPLSASSCWSSLLGPWPLPEEGALDLLAEAMGVLPELPALQEAIEFVRKGDTIVVSRIDRLARSLRDLQNIVHELQENGVQLQATEQPIDTSSAAGKCFLDMLGVFAEFETNLRKERQKEGIEKAKAEGKYKGRKTVLTPEVLARIKEAKLQGGQ